MADVFVSYKRDERNTVERLAEALRQLGMSVWFDARLSAGDRFSDEIEREARNASAIIVCWSPGSATSQWVKAEAQLGFEHEKLLPIVVSGPSNFRPPLPFNSIHTEDLRSWLKSPEQRDPAWLSLLRRLGALTDRGDLTSWGALGHVPINGIPKI